MNKSKQYSQASLDANAISALVAYLEATGGKQAPFTEPSLAVRRGNEKWRLSSVAEFLAEIRHGYAYASIDLHREKLALDITAWNHPDKPYIDIAVGGSTREDIEKYFQKVEEVVDRCRVPLPPVPVEPPPTPVVYIGHGKSNQWRDLKDHLTDKHGLRVEAFEVGSRAGHAIRDILDEMLEKSTIAFLVLTGEDEGVDGAIRARENVIHELGLFQGRLGFPRAVALLEDGTNEFSNLHGIQQIRFARGNIREVFGEVLAVIRREFGEERG
jgi:predicted nucleotide-binding protein